MADVNKGSYSFYLFLLFLISLKLRYNDINRFHLNELELIILAPLIKFFFDASITSHLRSPLEVKKGKKEV